MKSNFTAIPGTRRSKAFVAILAAGIMTAVGAGSYISWTANADERPEAFDKASSQLSINVDSLYTAMAAEEPLADSSSIAPIDPARTIAGKVSWYGPGFHGRRTASGERFDRNDMTAAHKSLPFGSLVRVVDVTTGKGVLVRINDRGPYHGGRVLDLSEEAADRLGIRGRGTASARLEVYSNSVPGHGEGTSSLTFDDEGRAVIPNGYAVKLADIASFEDAITMQQRLQHDGHKNVYLTQVIKGKQMVYQVSTGLFGSERFCRSLLAEISDQFKLASIVHFDAGAPLSTNFAQDTTTDTSDLF